MNIVTRRAENLIRPQWETDTFGVETQELFGMMKGALVAGTQPIDCSEKNDSGFLDNVQQATSLVRDVPTLEEKLFDARMHVKISTSRVSMHLESETIRKLHKQIDMLHEPEDWHVEDEAVNAKSYETFLKYMILEKPKVGPGLALGDGGNIVAVWMNKEDRLVLEFLSSENVRWMVSKTFDGEEEAGAGKSLISRLPSILQPYGADIHFFRKEI